jgi:Uma2 family endonuclease
MISACTPREEFGAMTAQPKPFVSEEEYLAFERASPTRHEYYRGVVYAMTGGKEPHNLIAGNTHAALHAQLRRKQCRVYQSDMRIKILQTGLNTYPDVVVVCGQPQFTDSIHDTIVNPVVIVEVLSESTERYDRGMKFQHYQAIPTLQDYLLIAQDQRRVEHFARQDDDRWLLRSAVGADAQVAIDSIACILTLEDVYEKADLEAEMPDLPRDSLPPQPGHSSA